MKNLTKLSVSILALVMLASCAGEGTSSGTSQSSSDSTSSTEDASGSDTSSGESSSDSSGTSSEEEESSITFAAVRSLAASLLTNEANASHEYIKESTSRDGNGTVIETELDIYADHSSRGLGERYYNVDITKLDELTPETFEVRRDLDLESYLNTAGGTNEITVFKEVTDYVGTTTDEAEKLFVLTAEEAEILGMSSGSYITSGTENQYMTGLVAYELYQFVATVESDVYIEQVGPTSFTYETNSEGITYSFNGSYSYDDSDYGITTTIIYTCQFLTNTSKTRLLAYSASTAQTDTSKTDPEDTTTSITSYASEIDYNGQEASAPEGTISTDDYFMTSISAFKWSSTYDDDLPSLATISLGSYTYIKAVPTAYLPEKAADIVWGSLYFVSSSDNSVIAVEEGDNVMEIVASGTTTITLAYFGKGEDGIWKEYELQQEVTVTENVTGISLGTVYDDLGYNPIDNIIYIGSTYTQTINITPNTIKNKNLTVTSSDATLATVTYDSGTLTVIPLSEGQITITLVSEANPEISQTETFTIKNYFTDEEIKTILTSNTWFWDGAWFDTTLTFAEDGTGTSSITNGTDTYEGTFTYSISNHEISTADWTDESTLHFGTDTEEPSEPGLLTQDAEGNYVLRFERASVYSVGTFGVLAQ